MCVWGGGGGANETDKLKKTLAHPLPFDPPSPHPPLVVGSQHRDNKLRPGTFRPLRRHMEPIDAAGQHASSPGRRRACTQAHSERVSTILLLCTTARSLRLTLHWHWQLLRTRRRASA